MHATSSGTEQLKISIADIVILIDNLKFRFDDTVERFAVFDQAEPDVCICLHYEDAPDMGRTQMVFNSGAEWMAFQKDGRYIIEYGGPFYQTAVFQSDFMYGDIYFTKVPRTILRHRFLSFLMIHLLSLGRGLALHGCGVDDNGRGMIFTGPSGAGKSTIGTLWYEHSSARVLSDECVILREKDSDFWIYSTPWCSMNYLLSPRESSRLEHIFFLRHGRRNVIERKSGCQAASFLFTRTYPPFNDPLGVSYLLSVCAQLSDEVPCYEFAFVPDKSAIDTIRSMT